MGSLCKAWPIFFEISICIEENIEEGLDDPSLNITNFSEDPRKCLVEPSSNIVLLLMGYMRNGWASILDA